MNSRRFIADLHFPVALERSYPLKVPYGNERMDVRRTLTGEGPPRKRISPEPANHHFLTSRPAELGVNMPGVPNFLERAYGVIAQIQAYACSILLSLLEAASILEAL